MTTLFPQNPVRLFYFNPYPTPSQGRDFRENDINFRVFRVFRSFSQKFLPLEILNHQNAKVNKINKTGQFSKVTIYF